MENHKQNLEIVVYFANKMLKNHGVYDLWYDSKARHANYKEGKNGKFKENSLV